MPEFPVDGPVTVAFKIPSGSVDVVAEERATAAVEVLPANGREESRRLAEETTVEFHGDALAVTAPDRYGFRLRSGSLTVKVRVPVGSSVSGKVASADTACHGTFGGVSVESASGDVQVDHVSGDAAFTTASGDVRVGRVDGHLRSKGASGDLRAQRVGGTVGVKVASGDVSLEDVGGDVSLDTASGDVNIGRAATGTIQIGSASGDVRVGVVAGTGVWFDLKTLSGDTRNRLDTSAPAGAAEDNGNHLTLQIRTLSGDIFIHRA